MYLEEFRADIADFLGCLAARLLPLVAAEAGKLHIIRIDAGVAAHEIQRGDRDEELRALRLQREVDGAAAGLVGRAVQCGSSQADG